MSPVYIVSVILIGTLCFDVALLLAAAYRPPASRSRVVAVGGLYCAVNVALPCVLGKVLLPASYWSMEGVWFVVAVLAFRVVDLWAFGLWGRFRELWREATS